MLRQLPKAQKDFRIDLVRDHKGHLDLLSTLEQINEATMFMDPDEKAAALQKTFGDEGSRGLIPLLLKLKELKKAQEDVRDSSKGIIDENFTNYLRTSAAQLRIMSANIEIATNKLGAHFLPILNSAGPQLSKLIDKLGNWTAANPEIVKGIGAVALSLIGLKAASAVLKPVSGLAKGGIGLARSFLGGGKAAYHRMRGRGAGAGAGKARGAAKGRGIMSTIFGAKVMPVEVVNWPGGFGGMDLDGRGKRRKGRSARERFKRRGKTSKLGRLGRMAGAMKNRTAGLVQRAVALAPKAATMAPAAAPLLSKASGLLPKAGGMAAKAAPAAGKAAASVTAKLVPKLVAKSAGKSLLKKIPILGALAGAGFAVDRAIRGDWLGAGGEVLSGLASTVPVIGTAASLAIDAGLMARDIAFQSGGTGEPPADQSRDGRPGQGQASAGGSPVRPTPTLPFNAMNAAWAAKQRLNAQVDATASGKKLVDTFASGIESKKQKPVSTVGRILKTVRSWLPFSDAKQGPLSQLTASGQALVHTFGAGMQAAGPGPLIKPLAAHLAAAQKYLSHQGIIARAHLQTGIRNVTSPTEGPAAWPQVLGPQDPSRSLSALIDELARATAPQISLDGGSINFKYSPTINGVAANQESIKKELDRDRRELERFIQRTLDQVFQKHQKLSMGNVNA
jgi:hypothetical protein